MEATVQSANYLAYIALFSWPFVAIVLFLTMPPRWACAVTLIAGDMFLPPQFAVHFSGLPPIDKDLMVSISALLGCLIVKPRAIFGRSREGRRYYLFVVILIIGAYFTASTNTDSLKVGRGSLPGLTSHDFFSVAVRHLLFWWPAFFLGKKLFTTADDLRVLFTVLTVGGLVYSLPIFIELKLSPQLNGWVYGYSAASFDQSIRWGGYRPTVFMRHGLNVALFMLMSVIAATGLARTRTPVFGLPASWLALYLGLVLVSCHSVGALFYGIVLIPALLWMRPKRQARLSITLAALVFLYPLLRFYDLIPVDSVSSFFNAVVGPDRAQSLEFRLINEGELLGKAILRPWFGWGGWGRQFTYYDWGGRRTTPDGEWIVVLGSAGVVGFIGIFGLMLFPIFQFARKKLPRMVSRRDAILGATALFIATAYVFDLLPNSGVAPYLMMTIGALAGFEVDDWSPEPVLVDQLAMS
jgi:hypothetical protein